MTIENFKDNQQAQFVYKIISNTNESVFLTGRAGTGKSTLLKTILENVKKKIVVCAPTGIAAKNVKGVTLHSMFKLPLGVVFSTDRQLQNMFYRDEQVLVFRTMQVLVIDEISMVPSYLLDCVDAILRNVRSNDQPFGGVQIFLIGDPFQLTPVVKSEEKLIIKSRYESELFFDANVIDRLILHKIELIKCYRQQEGVFMDILDTIRTKDISLKDLKILNETCLRKFTPQKETDLIVTLTTTNKKAEQINNFELAKINNPMFVLKAIVTGVFDVRGCIADDILYLKVGAHVMFLKNQSKKGYYNGTLGIVKEINTKDGFVKVLTEDGIDVDVKEEAWEDFEYHYNEETDEYEKHIIGSMSQIPLRLNFACTCHKAQGLTFNRMLLDTGWGAFASGQIYVALSRCRSIENLYLENRILLKEIIVDRRVVEFYKTLQNKIF